MQKSSVVPQKPNLEQQTFSGHLSCPGAEPFPHSASASQLEVQLPPLETSVQKVSPKPQSPVLPLQHAPYSHGRVSNVRLPDRDSNEKKSARLHTVRQEGRFRWGGWSRLLEGLLALQLGQ